MSFEHSLTRRAWVCMWPPCWGDPGNNYVHAVYFPILCTLELRKLLIPTPGTFSVIKSGVPPLLSTFPYASSTFPGFAQTHPLRPGLGGCRVWCWHLVSPQRAPASASVRGGLFRRPLSPSSLCPRYFCWPLLSRNLYSLGFCYTEDSPLFFEVTFYFFLASFLSSEPWTIQCSPAFYLQAVFIFKSLGPPPCHLLYRCSQSHISSLKVPPSSCPRLELRGDAFLWSFFCHLKLSMFKAKAVLLSPQGLTS